MQITPQFILEVVTLVFLFPISRKLRKLRKDVRKLQADNQQIIAMLEEIKSALKPIGAESIVLMTIIDGKEQEVNGMNLKVTQMIPLIAKGKDKKGNAAEIENAQFKSSDESLAVIEMVEGVAHLKPVGPLGALVVSVDADGLIGEGEKPLHFEGAVNLIAGDAEVLDLEFGAPIDIPDAQPEQPVEEPQA